jgi:hypothetical protein
MSDIKTVAIYSAPFLSNFRLVQIPSATYSFDSTRNTAMAHVNPATAASDALSEGDAHPSESVSSVSDYGCS